MSGLDSWLRQASLWRCVEHLAAGDTVPHPISVELHLGTACNLACPECVSRPILDSASFSHNRAVEIAQELAATGVRCVVLSGGGEPLLHPAAGDVLQSLHEAGLQVGLVTNATLLHHHLERVVACTDRIRVSIDAATQDTYERFRPHAGGESPFPRLIDNLKAIAPRTRGRLTYSFVLHTRRGTSTQTNVGDLAAAAALAKSVGCTTFEVNIGFDKHLQPDPAHALVAPQLKEQLHCAMQLADEEFRVFADPFIVALARGHGLAPLPDRAYSYCPAAQIRALVSPRGVFLCPRHQGTPHACYGDPNTTALETIWGGEAFRSALDSIDPRRDCPGACMSMELNEKLLGAVSHLLTGGATPELRADDDLFL